LSSVINDRVEAYLVCWKAESLILFTPTLPSFLRTPCISIPFPPVDNVVLTGTDDIAVTDLWPTLLPGLASGAPNTEAEVAQWLSRALTSPALFDAFMYGAATHMQTRRRLGNVRIEPQTNQEKRELIVSEAETIKHLNRVMRDPSHAITDETILAVLCMGFNRVDGSAWPRADPPLKPPLRNLQWLNVYGTLSGNEIHVRGMIKLIEMKGGLESLKMPGLAETVSLYAKFQTIPCRQSGLTNIEICSTVQVF
jgi:hypothetical protein